MTGGGATESERERESERARQCFRVFLLFPVRKLSCRELSELSGAGTCREARWIAHAVPKPHYLSSRFSRLGFHGPIFWGSRRQIERSTEKQKERKKEKNRDRQDKKEEKGGRKRERERERERESGRERERERARARERERERERNIAPAGGHPRHPATCLTTKAHQSG